MGWGRLVRWGGGDWLGGGGGDISLKTVITENKFRDPGI